ncbi:glycoside hydrolase family 28 protein [Echinicola strongylocentroti]|uniref:Glycoside hydrolase family 28 protein n=1 Tax=Echinicola strongylocentroti TaxID=1795355 RepID=A0A2Z4IRU6_9BACT|nr:glycoside hydrolase family 28 protein [Echinicola strongylocentroti]AWW33296.1 glycoside hydrolase family 28 protein [Echinicola strongylocentroti]
MINRFQYHSLFVMLLGLALMAGCKQEQQKEESKQPNAWDQVAEILETIQAPEFPDRTFSITDYGAEGNGETDASKAIKEAIEACAEAGGGRVLVPEGDFVTGPIYLESNVNLHLKKGARLLFSTDPKDYLPLVYTRWEGVELMNYSPLVYAFEEENIAVTGEGVLDGQADETNWWPWKGKTQYGYTAGDPQQEDADKRHALFQMAEDKVPVEERKFGEGFYLRPQFVQPYRCKNVLIEGVKIVNSPMWILNPVLCENVTIQGVTVESHGPNSDGCDPESSKNVLIKDCYFNTGDDCIAIKSGRNADGRRINVPSENIIIQDCKMADGHGGVVIGSEISGGVRNVFAEDCEMNSPHLDRALRIKTSSMRGGVIEDIYLRNIDVGQIAQQVIRVNMFYEDSGAYVPTVRNIHVENMTVENGGKVGVLLEGYKSSPVENIKLENVSIKQVKEDFKFSNVKNVHFENVMINGKTVSYDQE